MVQQLVAQNTFYSPCYNQSFHLYEICQKSEMSNEEDGQIVFFRI
jgi:hypothetical protein